MLIGHTYVADPNFGVACAISWLRHGNSRKFVRKLFLHQSFVVRTANIFLDAKFPTF